MGRVQHGSELARNGKRGPSAAAQVDPFGHVNQPLGGEARQPAEDHVVSGKVQPPAAVQAGGETGPADTQGLRHGWRHHGGSGGMPSSTTPYTTPYCMLLES